MPKALAIRVGTRHYAVCTEKLTKAFQSRPIEQQSEVSGVMVWVPSGQIVQLNGKLSRKKKKLKVAPQVTIWTSHYVCKDEAIEKGYVIAETL